MLAGKISPEIGLARLVLGGVAPDHVRHDLAAYGTNPATGLLLDFITSHHHLLSRLGDVFAGLDLDHDQTGDTALIEQVARAYDAAVRRSPEASVAAYSLGDPATLRCATDELVAWLMAASLVPEDALILDIGCGIGRVAAALLPRSRSVLGLDVSAGMVAEAQRRHSDPGLQFRVTHGRDLTAMPSSAFDLILAVDCFPYLIQAGVAAAHVVGAARILRPGGAFCLFNFSYRDNPSLDYSDAAGWATECALTLECAGDRPFRIWDADAWVFRRADH